MNMFSTVLSLNNQVFDSKFRITIKEYKDQNKKKQNNMKLQNLYLQKEGMNEWIFPKMN